jgi:cell division protease FtsH
MIANVNTSPFTALNRAVYNKHINRNPFARKYYEEYLQKKNNTIQYDQKSMIIRKYPLTKPHYIDKLRRLNSKNTTIQNRSILGFDQDDDQEDKGPVYIIPVNHQITLYSPKNNDHSDNDDFDYDDSKKKSQNFEVMKKCNTFFKDVGGYENVKRELDQCVDILKNYKKYEKYNVRIPKGLILEGPPGTGKTLLAKALAGESRCNFISVAGSDFQEKYVGVGPTRIKELFTLAKKNVPCIIFIDEIDAVGKKRSSDGESSSSERDNTLNALLVELDGFKNNTGIFVVSATNRIDLLDEALVRPGRIDKKIYIGLPDKNTREAILNIHICGKPYTDTVILSDLVEITEGLSGAQIENLLNEAMLNALRNNMSEFSYKDVDFVLNKMMAGWQPNDHTFTTDIIDHIAIHEMGHAIVGILSKHHSKVSKVVINLSSPKSPGYTVFEGSTSNIYTRNALFEHLMILLAGRIAEEAFYGVSVTTGALNDFEEALKLAEKMIIYYGMGNDIIYPRLSDKYKELIDTEVINLINQAYKCSELIVISSKDFIKETSETLKREKIIKVNVLYDLIQTKYKYLEDLKIEFE